MSTWVGSGPIRKY